MIPIASFVLSTQKERKKERNFININNCVIENDLQNCIKLFITKSWCNVHSHVLKMSLCPPLFWRCHIVSHLSSCSYRNWKTQKMLRFIVSVVMGSMKTPHVHAFNLLLSLMLDLCVSLIKSLSFKLRILSMTRLNVSNFNPCRVNVKK